MVVKETSNTKVIEFSSINELVKHNREGHYTSDFKNKKASGKTDEKMIVWCGTSSYGEAEDLLLHGWEYMAKELKSKIDVNLKATGYTQKSVYDVVGFTPSVPRYLQGIPTNMINAKRIPKKEKIITINKSISYSWKASRDEIIQESVRVLNLVNSLELQGYRVKLNIVWKVSNTQDVWGFGTSSGKLYVVKVNVKQPTQRLNMKQIAFPMVHPSMLRRICFKTIETDEWCNGKNFHIGYGIPNNTSEGITSGEYYIPAMEVKGEITNLEKYLVR